MPDASNHATYERLAGDFRLRRFRPDAVEKYTRCVRAFDAFQPDRPLAMRDRDDVRAWLLHLVDEWELAPSTYLVHLAALRFLFTCTLARPEVVAHVPAPIRRPGAPVPVLSRAEVARLLEAAPTPLARLAFEVGYDTGLRLREICRLERSDVEGALVHVRDGKGGRSRVVRVGARLRAALGARRPHGRFLFSAPADRPVAPRTVSRWFRRAARRAALPDGACFRALRRAFARHLHDHGADLRALQVALGHRSLATTERYLGPSDPAPGSTPSPLDRLAA